MNASSMQFQNPFAPQVKAPAVNKATANGQQMSQAPQAYQPGQYPGNGPGHGLAMVPGQQAIAHPQAQAFNPQANPGGMFNSQLGAQLGGMYQSGMQQTPTIPNTQPNVPFDPSDPNNAALAGYMAGG